jgi:hypothetical protein
VRCWSQLTVLWQLAVLAIATQAAPIVVFDEDDPIGSDYYDSSVVTVKAPSQLKLGSTEQNKLPILSGVSQKGEQSALCQWTSNRGGDWIVRIYSPGFQTRNLSGFDALVLAVNGPVALNSSALPAISIETTRRERTKALPLGQFLLEGLDGNTNTWQEVRIPLATMLNGTGLDLTRFQSVNLSQSAADGVEHTLWIDSIRFVSSAATEPPLLSGAPKNLVARAGDRSIALHWNKPARGEPEGYQIYRANSETGPFRAISKPVRIQSWADVNVENGRTYFYHLRALNESGEGLASNVTSAMPRAFEDDDEFLDLLERTAFDYFWYEANPNNGMIRDRSEPFSAASIAAIGFGLTGIGIAIDRGYITREAGANRVLHTLETLWNAPQGNDVSGTSGYRGWFYHFLEMETGLRAGTSELSSIDTGLLLLGIVYCEQYFYQPLANEKNIRELASKIFSRVDWNWMRNGGATLTHGWFPNSGFIKTRWIGYSEAALLYILGLGASGTNALPDECWTAWTRGYEWESYYGYDFVPFAPLFGHQYTACWLDLRYIADDYMRAKGITYFQNTRRATLAQRAYCIANPKGQIGYGTNCWGLTACDGPSSYGAFGYMARGAPPSENDDGTIAPTAPGGSLVFAPEFCVPALREMYDRYREKIWCGYGFRDAFNLKQDWWGPDVIGIDQGPILLMADNLRYRQVWNVMKRSPIIQRGWERAGFK